MKKYQDRIKRHLAAFLCVCVLISTLCITPAFAEEMMPQSNLDTDVFGGIQNGVLDDGKEGETADFETTDEKNNELEADIEKLESTGTEEAKGPDETEADQIPEEPGDAEVDESTTESDSTETDASADGVSSDGQQGEEAATDLQAQETETIKLTAGLYNDADRTDLNQMLTAEGATVSGWEYTRNLTLGLSVKDIPHIEGVQYRLVIEMDPILYFDLNQTLTVTNASVTFIPNDPIPVNTDSQYQVHDNSYQEMTIEFDEDCTELSFGLPVAYDVNLWNKRAGSNIGNGTPLLTVYLEKVTTVDEESSVVETVDNNSFQLAQATSGSGLPLSPSVGLYANEASMASSTIGIGGKIRLHVGRSNNTSYSYGYFDRNIQIELTVPECIIGGTTYHLEYDGTQILTSGGKSELTSTKSDGKLTLSAENFYFSNGSIANIYFLAPTQADFPKGVFKFVGKIKVTADGVDVVPERQFTITLDNAAQPILGAVSTNGNANIIDVDTVQYLGRMALNNTAAAGNNSGELRVALEFDINNTKAIGVTSVKLMADRMSENIDITYSLVDEVGNLYKDASGKSIFSMKVRNQYYNPSAASAENLHQLFNRSLLPTEQQGYYFKTITYSIGTLAGNTYAYHTGADRAPYSAGTVWGYLLVDEIPMVKPQNRMIVYDAVSGQTIDKLTKTISVNIDANTKASFGIESATLSAPSIEAGESVTIGGTLFECVYPYTNNNCLNDICLGIVLPEGITVNESSVTGKYQNGTLAVVKSVTSQSVQGTSNNFWIIQFEGGNKIGYFSEKLDGLANGTTFKFSFQLNTAQTLSTQTISLKEAVFAAGKDRMNGIGGSYGDHLVVDTYDLNRNGQTSDNVACFGKETELSFTVTAAPAQLKITDSIRTATGAFTSNLSLTSADEVFYYDLTVQCTRGGSASDFFYLIPVGKMSTRNESNFLVKSQVDFKLNGPVQISTKSGTPLTVEYAFDSGLTYSQANNATWYSELPDGKSWIDVTMVKVVAGQGGGVIENGSDNVISLPLVYGDDYTTFSNKAGMQVCWKGRGYYHYQLGANTSAGNGSTDGVTVTLTYAPVEPREVYLTAFKEGNGMDGDSKTASFQLIEFFNIQEYTITSISPSNVNLVSDEQFDEVTSKDANSNFRISVSVKKDGSDTAGTEVDILKEGEVIGELEENSVPVFTFMVYNGDAISDIVTPRSVSMTIIGSNGVVVPVTIHINRRMTPAEAVDSAIVSGKQYVPFSGSKEVHVSEDSALTVQFFTKGYIPANYTDSVLKLSNRLAAGTTITMVDRTDANNVQYYHYSVKGTEEKIPLQDFRKMGSGEMYSNSSGQSIDETLLFVLQFPENGAGKNNNIQLERTLVENNSNSQSESLSYSVVEKRKFGLELDKNSVKTGEVVTVECSTSCGISDSRYNGRQLSLVISAEAGTTLTPDSMLDIDGTMYYLNSMGQFIVPLGDINQIQNMGWTKCIRLLSRGNNEVNLKVELWASAIADAARPRMGDCVASEQLTVIPVKVPSLRVDSMSSRLIHRDELGDSVSVSYDTLDTETVTLEVQKKDASGYVTQTSVLESVNNTTTAISGKPGVFAIDKSGGAATLRFSASMPSGTYRLLFTGTNGSEKIEVPFNFIVID